MISLRRATVRVLQSRPSTAFSVKARVHNYSRPALSAHQPQKISSSLFQRRWVSESAAAEQKVEDSQEPPRTEAEAEAIKSSSSAIVEEPLEEVIDQRQLSTGRIEQAKEAVSDAVSSVGNAIRGAASGDQYNPDPEVAASSNVYVGNLFFDVSEDELRLEFGRAGNVSSANIIKDPRGRSKGFGYVKFEDKESADRAVEMFNTQVFEGRRINVQKAVYRAPRAMHQERPPAPPSDTLFIGNLSYEMTDRELNVLFRGLKDVVDVRVAIDRRTGQPRGFAHADFSSMDAAKIAFGELNGKVVGGRTLRIDYSKPVNRAAPGGTM